MALCYLLGAVGFGAPVEFELFGEHKVCLDGGEARCTGQLGAVRVNPTLTIAGACLGSCEIGERSSFGVE